jgi:hypothetical protein
MTTRSRPKLWVKESENIQKKRLAGIPSQSLFLNATNLLLEPFDVTVCFLNGCMSKAFSLPSFDPVFLLADGSAFGVRLLANATLLLNWVCLHNQFHATSLAGAVFLGTVLTEVSPSVIATSISFLIVETHPERSASTSPDR